MNLKMLKIAKIIFLLAIVSVQAADNSSCANHPMNADWNDFKPSNSSFLDLPVT